MKKKSFDIDFGHGKRFLSWGVVTFKTRFEFRLIHTKTPLFIQPSGFPLFCTLGFFPSWERERETAKLPALLQKKNTYKFCQIQNLFFCWWTQRMLLFVWPLKKKPFFYMCKKKSPKLSTRGRLCNQKRSQQQNSFLARTLVFPMQLKDLSYEQFYSLLYI